MGKMTAAEFFNQKVRNKRTTVRVDDGSTAPLTMTVDGAPKFGAGDMSAAIAGHFAAAGPDSVKTSLKVDDKANVRGQSSRGTAHGADAGSFLRDAYGLPEPEAKEEKPRRNGTGRPHGVPEQKEETVTAAS